MYDAAFSEASPFLRFKEGKHLRVHVEAYNRIRNMRVETVREHYRRWPSVSASVRLGVLARRLN